MEKILNEITTIIETYHSLEYNTNEEKAYSELLKNLSSNLFFLEKHRAELYNKHNEVMLLSKLGVGASKMLADKEVPEIYMLRRIMNAAYKVADAMRSNISSLRSER